MLAAGTVVTLGAERYCLRAPLGGSAYGVVWRADGARGAVALKFINAAQMERAIPALRTRWIDSAANEITFLRSVAPWDERHIVRLLGSGEHAGLPVLVLELHGGDLARHVRVERDAGRPISLAVILDWLGQINQGLAKVHQYGWNYLDLKPGNVLLHPTQARVVLADFGTIARSDAPPVDTYAGTASWQAPEQFFSGPHGYDTDQRSDYFSLGALFYFLVTGGLPLRFCSALGQAWRAHGRAAAQLLMANHGGVLPPTLADDEARLFAQRIEASARADALALLTSLLAPRREDRPASEIEISRRLGKISIVGAYSSAAHGSMT